MDYWSFILTLLGTLIGIIGVFLAIYKNNEKKKMQKIIRANNWFNYERSNVSNGILQNALKLYKSRHSKDVDMDVLEYLAKADSFGQEVYLGVIRQILMFEPSIAQKDIERWRDEGKISDAKVKLFMKFAIEKNQGGA